MSKPRIALILGSGFSKDAGLSTTAEIPSKFLLTPETTVLTIELEEKISQILKRYWVRVFGYRDGGTPPSLEDHFTLLDLAANSGHNLGRYYSPKKLRAIRRMSIHRVFQILAVGGQKNELINKMLKTLNAKYDMSIVTLNWDLIVEKHLYEMGIDYYYPIETFKLLTKSMGEPWEREGIPIMKMHGSSNWIYCDSCRRIYSGKVAKSALTRKTFLEKDDFKLFGLTEDTLKNMFKRISRDRECPHCENTMGGRVATFSFRKAFSISQFQSLWERAYDALRKADIWLMAGYSLPQADFEFLHLLKSAQMARNDPDALSIEAIIQGNAKTVNRYRGFYGENNLRIEVGGLEKWIEDRMNDFILEHRQ